MENMDNKIPEQEAAIEAEADKTKTAEAVPNASGETVCTIGVQHRRAGDIYSFLSQTNEVRIGQPVIVEGEHGESLAIVVTHPREVLKSDLPANMKKIVRIATDEDLRVYAKQKEEAGEYFEICEKKIEEHKLPMKLVDAEMVDSGKKVILFFFAEQRVDFRSLVKDLASITHKYIEMRQIGSRDATSFIGCMGTCGRTTCCSSYLRNFQSISIAMAKNQGLSPNPVKLTGMCGKLKCCLAYENKAYGELRKGLPKVGNWVETPKGTGKIVNIDILKRQCAVRFEEGGEARFGCEECAKIDKQQYDKAKAEKAAEKGEERPARRERPQGGRRNQREKKPDGK